MKDDGTEGLIPEFCFYRRYEGAYSIRIRQLQSTKFSYNKFVVYADFRGTTPEEITVKTGDVVGLVDRDSFEGYWKVNKCLHGSEIGFSISLLGLFECN